MRLSTADFYVFGIGEEHEFPNELDELKELLNNKTENINKTLHGFFPIHYAAKYRELKKL